jgi:phage baseplate assembly protein V
MAASNDNPRRQDAAIRYGTIESVEGAFCRVQSGDLLTDNIRWLALRAGASAVWDPPSADEQCVLLCPGGDTHGALALVGIFSDAFPPPSISPDEYVRTFPDDARITYNHQAPALTAQLPEVGTAEIIAAGGVTIRGPLNVVGDVSIQGDAGVTGTVDATVDVIGGGKRLKTHKHSAVQSGGSTSGPPA